MNVGALGGSSNQTGGLGPRRDRLVSGNGSKVGKCVGLGCTLRNAER